MLYASLICFAEQLFLRPCIISDLDILFFCSYIKSLILEGYILYRIGGKSKQMFEACTDVRHDLIKSLQHLQQLWPTDTNEALHINLNRTLLISFVREVFSNVAKQFLNAYQTKLFETENVINKIWSGKRTSLFLL